MPTEEPLPSESPEAENSLKTQREFLDRAMREALQKPYNLRSLAEEFVPEEIEHLDFDNMHNVERELFGENWNSREADVFFEVPYRDAELGTNAFVCVLVEHQSSTDYHMALRTLDCVVRYWDRERRLWEHDETNEEPFRLTPVLPIVLCTNKQKWGSFRSLEQLLAPPQTFHRFAPKWEFLLWELATHSAEALLDSQNAFMQTIAILHAEKADLNDAQRLFEKILGRLEGLFSQSSARWADMVKFLLGWVQNRRPAHEHASWKQFAKNLQTNEETKKELANMELTIAQAIEQKAEQRAEKRAEVRLARRLLVRFGTERFGAPAPEIAEKIEANQDVELLSELVGTLHNYDSWQAIADKL